MTAFAIALRAESAARRLRRLLACLGRALVEAVLHARLDDEGRPVMLAPPSSVPLLVPGPAPLPRTPAPAPEEMTLVLGAYRVPPCFRRIPNGGWQG